MPAQKIALGYAEHQLLSAHLKAQLDDFRESLECHAIGEVRSEYLRGRIAELRALLELITP